MRLNVCEVHVALPCVLVPGEHAVYGLRQLCTASLVDATSINPHPFHTHIIIDSCAAVPDSVRASTHELAQVDNFSITEPVPTATVAEVLLRNLAIAPAVGEDAIRRDLPFEELVKHSTPHIQ